MSVKTDIQTAIIQTVQAGTFTKVTYNESKLPVEGEATTPKSVLCNEITGSVLDSARQGAVGSDFVIRDWRFEAHAEFAQEVDVSYFLLNELKNIKVTTDGVMVTITPGDFNVEHPTRSSSHNGTKLKIGLTANTRR